MTCRAGLCAPPYLMYPNNGRAQRPAPTMEPGCSERISGLQSPPTRRCILKFTPMGGGLQKPDLLSGWNQYSMRQEECLKRRVTATVVSNRFKRGRDGFLFFYGCERA